MKTDCPNCKNPMEKLPVNHPLDYWCEKCNYTSLFRDYTKNNASYKYTYSQDYFAYKFFIVICIIAILNFIAVGLFIYSILNK